MTSGRRRSAYHHGDLRNAALAKAQFILDAEGERNLSLRRVATEVGVSPMALYNHFDDKEALLVALAERGFVALGDAILAAAPPDEPALERLQNGAVAYVMFAMEHREQFQLMFGGVSEALAKASPLRQAARCAFSTLTTCLEDCKRAGLLRGDPIAAERAVWSAAHGYASLWNSVPELMRGERALIRKQMEQMLGAMLQGL